MKVQVDVNNSVINWILEQVQNELVSRKYLELLYDWQTNERKPTFSQIEKVSKATRIPLGYFFLDTPPIEDTSLLEYRTIDSVDNDWMSRNLKDTVHDMKNIQEWMKTHQKLQNADALEFVGSQSKQKDIIEFAKYIRKLLDINEDWYIGKKDANDSFNYLRRKMSAIGVLVMMSGVVGNNTHRTLSIDEFRAFSLIDDYAPLVFINSADSYNGRLFSLIHEFAHILMGKNSLYNDRFNNQGVSEEERVCNAVAAEILIPNKQFDAKWEESNGEDAFDRIKNLSNFFSCGQIVVARRALDRNYINQKQYNEIVNAATEAYNKNKSKSNSGGDYYRTQASRIDLRFLNSLMQSVQEGQTQYSEAFRLTNTNRTTFENLLARTGGDIG